MCIAGLSIILAQVEVNAEKYKIVLLEQGIIENIIFSEVLIDTEMVLKLKKENMLISGEKPYCVLVNVGEHSEATNEARELVASAEFVQITIAKAIMINSLPHRLMGNFYLKINKPKIKTRLFTDRAQAIEWLRSEIEAFKKIPA